MREKGGGCAGGDKRTEERGNSEGSCGEDEAEVGCCSLGLCRGSLSGAGWAQQCFSLKRDSLCHPLLVLAQRRAAGVNFSSLHTW